MAASTWLAPTLPEEQADPAASYNRQLLSKYESALNAFAHELSKYEDKPGEVQTSMDEMQKNLDAAQKQ